MGTLSGSRQQEAGRRLFKLPLDSPDIDVLKQIREERGADE